MAVAFHKMHGTGNDFVLLDLRRQAFELTSDRVRQLADRHTGIGFDQLLVIREPARDSEMADFEVWNADGSRAEQCGNGVRCMGHYLQREQGDPGHAVRLGGPAGSVELTMVDDGLIRVDMGSPRFEPGEIPLTLAPKGRWYELDTRLGRVRAGAVSMGNPHAVIPVDNLHAAHLPDLGLLINTHPAFPNGCNAGFAQVIDRKTVQLRVFERGAGETRSCGSGACAAAAVLIRAELIDPVVEIRQEGGTLKIEWPGCAAHLLMTGPATYVFQGTVA